MVADGTLVDADEFTHRLGMSAAKLDRDLEAGSLFCLQLDGRRLLPAVYLEPDLDRRTLRAVNRALCPLGPGSKLQFFLNPKVSLGGLTPTDAIRAGQRRAVVVAAESFSAR